MSILRDERLVALHDLVEVCRTASRHHHLAAELIAESLAGDRRAEELRALADQRAREADFFGERMLAENDIPAGPPAERSLLESIVAYGKGALSDAVQSLLADCRAQEEEVLARAVAAAGAPLRGDERQAAAALAEDARRRLELLFAT